MSLINAVRFLTILPLPAKREITEKDLGRATAWFPLVGALLGGMLALGARLFVLAWSPLTVNAFVLSLWVLLSRGLHLDGLADTADGLGGGFNREDKLAIMKDSRIGTFGVLAVFCLLLLKLVLLVELGEPGRHLYTRALILAPALGRWGMILAIFVFPPARKEGMGRSFKEHFRRQDLAFGTLTALGCSYLVLGPWGLALMGAAGLAAAAGGLVFSHILGGLTGDTYGALCEAGELLTLLLLSLPELP